MKSGSFRKLKIGLDCANGASWNIASSVFSALGAQVYTIGAEPDGLNVNNGGLVQRGYQNYSVVLDDAAKNKVEELDREWRNNGKALDDSIIIGSEKYRVNSGGAVYNSSTKVYDYEVKVYYNPSTKQLLTEEIAPGGGSIYITGAVSSTGNGRVRAMDGTADININTLNNR